MIARFAFDHEVERGGLGAILERRGHGYPPGWLPIKDRGRLF
jgi:hypothetical protein